jgi:Ser/Thr protein kinase RdoA (MazF antagonist)
VGSQRTARYRPRLETGTYARDALWRLEPFIFPELWKPYLEVSEFILDVLDDLLASADMSRIHGDCHRGNLLKSDLGYHLIDFDDCMTGPVGQDFWMLLNGRWPDDDATRDFDSLAEGYLELRALPDDVEEWFEPLRGYRVIMYSTWIAARWPDPSFQKLFPGFRDYNWWAEELRQLDAIARSL